MENEIWKDIEGFEGYYQVSNFGRIKSLERYFKMIDGRGCSVKEKIKKHRFDTNGYPVLNLWKGKKIKTVKIHRMMALAFIPNPENKPQINHKNGIKTDNRLENLEWATPSENSQHAFDTGLTIPRKGSEVNFAKITEGDVPEIRRLLKNGMYQKDIAKIYGVTQGVVQQINVGKTWKHVQ